MKTQIFIFAVISILFLSFNSTSVASDKPDTVKKGVVDLSSDTHTFELDTIIVLTHTKEVVYNVYKDGKKQPRKVKVIIDYITPERLRVSDAMFAHSSYKTSRDYVKVYAYVGNIELKNLYNYTFVDTALVACNVRIK